MLPLLTNHSTYPVAERHLCEDIARSTLNVMKITATKRNQNTKTTIIMQSIVILTRYHLMKVTLLGGPIKYEQNEIEKVNMVNVGKYG